MSINYKVGDEIPIHEFITYTIVRIYPAEVKLLVKDDLEQTARKMTISHSRFNALMEDWKK